jgi:hypothetical protein
VRIIEPSWQKIRGYGHGYARGKIAKYCQMCKQEGNSLNRDDMVILWCCSNDVAKNETNNGLKHLKKVYK